MYRDRSTADSCAIRVKHDTFDRRAPRFGLPSYRLPYSAPNYPPFLTFGSLDCRKCKKEVKSCQKFKVDLIELQFCSTGQHLKKGSNPWPPHGELAYRKKRKLLPFRKLQPPKEKSRFLFFPIPYHRLYVSCNYSWQHIGHTKME